MLKRYCSSLRLAWNVFLPIGKDESTLVSSQWPGTFFFLNANIPSVCRLLLLLTQNNCDIAIIPHHRLVLATCEFYWCKSLSLSISLSAVSPPLMINIMKPFDIYRQVQMFPHDNSAICNECQDQSAKFLALQWEWVNHEITTIPQTLLVFESQVRFLLKWMRIGTRMRSQATVNGSCFEAHI